MKLNLIKTQLDILCNQAQQIDQSRGENSKPLFDQKLFSCQTRLLLPCAREAQKILETLEQEQKNGHLSAERAEHLCEKLLNQISALKREMATLSIRQQEKRFSSKPNISINQLYQNLAQHQEWERRLENMVFDAQSQIDSSTDPIQRQALQQHMIASENRLARCRKAKYEIEMKITHLEKKG